MNRFENLTLKEIEQRGKDAALEGKSRYYDPFRNLDLSKDNNLEKNNAWFKGFDSVKIDKNKK